MENEFIKILGMAEWEDEVLEIIEKYNFLDPEEFEEGDSGYNRWTPSCTFASLDFDNSCETLNQKERKAEGNYYLNSMFFKFSGIDSDDNVIENKDGLEIPFGFKRGDILLLNLIFHLYYHLIDQLSHLVPHSELRHSSY